MNALARLPWISLSALAAALLLAGTIAVGWDRSFWFDEVYSLGAAALGRELDWALLRTDVHPPGYAVALHQLGGLLPADSPALRAFNLIGLAALLSGLAVLWKPLGRDRVLLLFAVLVVSGYGLQLSLDLRAYALLLGFGTLIQALFLREVLTGRPATLPLILLAAVLAALHYFGAALGLTILGLGALRAWQRKQLGRAAALLLAIAVITGAVLVYAVGYSTSGKAFAAGGNWIELGVGAFIDFAAEQLPLAVLTVLLLGFRQSMPVPEFRSAAMWMLAVPGVIVAVTGALSLIAPLISARNLTVCVPGVAIALVLLAPEPLLGFLRRTPVFLVVLVAAGLRYGDTGSRNFQMIEWAIETATPPACDGAVLYTLDTGNVSRFSQEVFLGEVRRPMVDMRSFKAPVVLPEGCDIIATGWHQNGTVGDVTGFFAQRGVETEAILPPDPRLSGGLMSPGYVIRLK